MNPPDKQSLHVIETGPEQSRQPVPPAEQDRQRNNQFALFGRWLFNTVVLAAGDGMVLMFSLFAGGRVRTWVKGSPMFPEWSWFLVAVWWAAAVAIRLLPGWGLGAVEELRRTVLLLIGVFAATSTALFLGKLTTETSRLTLTTGFLICLPLLPLVRTQLKRLLIAHQAWGMPSVIYGSRKTAGLVVDALKEEPGLGYMPTAIYDEDATVWGGELQGLPILEAGGDAYPYAPTAILAMPGISRQKMLTILEGPLARFRHVVVIPDLMEAPSLWVQPRDVGGILGLEISRNLLKWPDRFLKRATDLGLVLLTVPAWLPLTGLIALLVRLVDGPSAFFLQKRVGRRGKEFCMWKFRTMRHTSGANLQQHLDQDEAVRTEWEQNFKLENDPRITRLGKLLRRMSLDELPQLLHVLRGHMSLVGPRPLPAYHEQTLPDTVRQLRNQVRPGMTGFWQVSGRSAAGREGMIRRDTYYVRNWSVWLDAVILVRTIKAVWRGRGAF